MSPNVSRRMRAGRPRIGAGIAAGASLAAVVALGLAGGAASAPPNDALADAEKITSVPAKIDGTTKGAKLSKDEPESLCGTSVKGIVWYAVKAPRRGPMVARIRVEEGLSAAVVAYGVRSPNRRFGLQGACGATNSEGRASISWYAYKNRSYLIGVARQEASVAGAFRLTVLAAEPAPRPPGDPLPAGGTRATVDPILDALDAWAIEMKRGTTYGINLAARPCLSLAIYRPNISSFARAVPVQVADCGGYIAFTPGIDGGGTYSLVVRAGGPTPVVRPYRLEAAQFGEDDGAPGIKLENGQSVEGSIAGRGVDVVDLYRIGVPRENELTTLDLQQKPGVGLDLVVLTESGDQVACACRGTGRQVLREHLPPDHYYVAVRSREKSSGKYSLQVRIRDVTTTSISVGGVRSAEATPGRPVPLRVDVTSASHGGVVQIEIDRLEPLLGWQFSEVQKGNVSSGGMFTLNWTPPSVGNWRARARFLGTPYSSFSKSGYVLIHVAEPLG